MALKWQSNYSELHQFCVEVSLYGGGGGRRNLSVSQAICSNNKGTDASKGMPSCRELSKQHAGENPMLLSFIVLPISALKV